MGFFTFLTGEQEQPNPEGWKVRRKGKDYWEVNPDTPASPEDEITREDQTPIASGDELKPYTQRRGEASSKVFQAADRIIDRYATDKSVAEQTKREIRANPENAAKVVEKYLTGVAQMKRDLSAMAEGSLQTGKPDLTPYYDNDFTSLEDSVRGLRTMKRGVQEQALTGQIKETDLKKNLSELQNLKGQLEALTKDIASQNLPEAVSARGEAENKKILGQKQQQAAALAEHIKQLEATTGQKPGMVVNAPPAAPLNETPPQFKGPISHFMDGLGLDDGFVTSRIHAALDNIGIPKEQWGATDIEPTAGLMRVMSALDKNGDFARMVVQQIALARSEDAAEQQNQSGKVQQQPQQPMQQSGDQVNPAIAQTQSQIRSREQEIRQLYAELRQSPFMSTWPGIILYVLVGMLTQNPAFAARLIGGVGNRDAIDREIKGIQFELRRLDGQLARQEREEAYSKREAARRLQHKDDVADQRKWEMSKMMVQHNLIIQRNAARGNPETFIMKKLAGDFQRSLGMASKFQGEMDQYARAMNNELADPKSREDARRKWSDAKRNYDYYMQKAAGVDQDIRGIGGAAAAPEEDSEE